MIFFKDNKYSTWYYNICWRGQKERNLVYFEKHHIFPKCLGGDNDSDNITKLTAKEHFICHWLLVKMAANSFVYYKMNNALGGFTRKGHKRSLSSRQFDRARIAVSEFGKTPKTDNMRKKLSNYRKTCQLSQQTKDKISRTKKGIKHSAEHIKRRAESNKNNWTEQKREEYKQYGGRNKKPIRIGDTIYLSVNHAAKCMKLSPSNLRRMIRSKLIIPKYLQ